MCVISAHNYTIFFVYNSESFRIEYSNSCSQSHILFFTFFFLNTDDMIYFVMSNSHDLHKTQHANIQKRHYFLTDFGYVHRYVHYELQYDYRAHVEWIPNSLFLSLPPVSSLFFLLFHFLFFFSLSFFSSDNNLTEPSQTSRLFKLLFDVIVAVNLCIVFHVSVSNLSSFSFVYLSKNIPIQPHDRFHKVLVVISSKSIFTCEFALRWHNAWGYFTYIVFVVNYIYVLYLFDVTTLNIFCLMTVLVYEISREFAEYFFR